MATELDAKTANWLLALKVISQNDISPLGNSLYSLDEATSRSFENGLKVSPLVQ